MTIENVNHRTITGRKKSLATKKLLLSATLNVIGSKTIRFPTVEDVIKEAAVARGTFYKHFTSFDQAVEEVGLLLANEWISAISPIHANIANPLLRASLGTRLLLLTANDNKEWGRFMLRSNLTDPNSRLMQTIQNDVSEGMRQGKFIKADQSLTTQLVMGINWAAFERLIDGPKGQNTSSIINHAILTLLLALGVSKGAAQTSVTFSQSFIDENRPLFHNLFHGTSFGLSLSLDAQDVEVSGIPTSF